MAEPSIVCPSCERRSFNPQDIANRYCGQCAEFHAELLQQPIRTLRKLVQQFYGLCFVNNVGSDAHAFIEFNGLMGKYIELLGRAAEQGIHARFVNVHSQLQLRVEAHDMKYLGEKLRCIFGPLIDGNPAARAALRKAMFDD